MTSSEPERIRRVARDRFGIEALRPGQEDAIRAVLDGRDTLVIMPTGSGKSAIYQIAAQLISGPTLVVSPLIALQRDQVEALEAADAGGASELNSTLRTSERQDVLENLQQEDLEFLFLAPEQFANEETMAQLRAAKPSLFVVDEAHCISEWGHDFRPDYLRLGEVIERLGHPSVLALTATAAPPVRDEIVERLGMRDPALIVQGFNRPNIRLSVETILDPDEKRTLLVDRVVDSSKPGIVYAATRRDTEVIAADLTARGVSAAAYHGGLKATERDTIQQAFMEDEIAVIVATIAFGMGIDKPNVRFVFHGNISASLDAYYQEIGRAGRDGEPAEAVLFYDPKDLNLRRFQAGIGQVALDEVESVVEALMDAAGPVDPAALKRQLREELGELSDTKLTRMLTRLEDAGAIEMRPDGTVMLVASEADVEDVTSDVVEAEKNRSQYAHSRVEMMRKYAETTGCRREFLLNYFGETFDPPCNNCDNCLRGNGEVADDGRRPFPLQSTVHHRTLGTGRVMHYEGDTMIVLFDDAGYRTLSVDLVLKEGLLAPSEEA